MLGRFGLAALAEIHERRTSEGQITGGTLVSSVHSAHTKMKFSWSLAKEALVQHSSPGLAMSSPHSPTSWTGSCSPGQARPGHLRYPQGRLQDIIKLTIAKVVYSQIRLGKAQ